MFKGKLKSEDELDKGVLPLNAVPFREPKDMKTLNLACSIFILPGLVLIAVAVILRTVLLGHNQFFFNLWGALLSLLTVFPHELLHGIAFPQNATVEVWYSLKSAMALCFSTYPVSKVRFIFLSLLPNLVFGVLPLVLWVALPSIPRAVADILFTFGVLSLFMGCGDYLNVYNAALQMPKGTLTQLSGFHSYWYYPDK